MPITPRMSERPVGFIFRSNAGKESQILVPWPRIPVGSPAHIQPPPGRWSGNQASLAPRPIGFPPSLGSHLIHLEGMCPLGGGGREAEDMDSPSTPNTAGGHEKPREPGTTLSPKSEHPPKRILGIHSLSPQRILAPDPGRPPNQFQFSDNGASVYVEQSIMGK